MRDRVARLDANDASSQGCDQVSLRTLYEEVVSHYHRCLVNTASLSDTWVQTLKHRGMLYSFQDLLQMLAPGNKVNFWIDDLHYLIDFTAVDAQDPVIQRLLALGESDFGSPRKDLSTRQGVFSSSFLHHVIYAAKIIHAIEAQAIREPNVLEIGGGLGGVTSLLRNYFGDRLTLYLVDIPETLLIQEWYLRACFPEAATSYKATPTPVICERGALYFINAYGLESQAISFDVAINIDSMQEMTKATIEGYLQYIQRNISVGGLFYFQNHFGHSTASIAEPSEYPLDAHWTLRTAELAYQIECCAESEQARWILVRTAEPEDVETRTVILRLLWNGFVSGQLANSNAVVGELAQLPRRYAPADAIPAIERVLRAHEVALPHEWLDHLRQRLYFSADPFLSSFKTTVVPTREPKSLAQRHMEAIWCTQSAVLQLMRRVAEEDAAWSSERIERALQTLCGEHVLSLNDTEASEYWTAYVACLLMVLHEQDSAAALLRTCARQSSNPFWLIRFAYLFSRFQYVEDARRLLSRFAERDGLDYYLALKWTELQQLGGNATEAQERLRMLSAECGEDLPRTITLANTALRVGAFDVARAACHQLWTHDPLSRMKHLLKILNTTSSSTTLQGEMHTFVRTLIADEIPESDRGEDAVTYGALLLKLGEREQGAAVLRQTLRDHAMDYYRLAHVGKLLQEARFDALADECLERSLTLRPDSFLHHEYVGNVYFATTRYANAKTHFERSAALKPYLRHIQAKALYCALPNSVREAALFGAPADLALIFQRKQDFYHDIGLSNK